MYPSVPENIPRIFITLSHVATRSWIKGMTQVPAMTVVSEEYLLRSLVRSMKTSCEYRERGFLFAVTMLWSVCLITCRWISRSGSLAAVQSTMMPGVSHIVVSTSSIVHVHARRDTVNCVSSTPLRSKICDECSTIPTTRNGGLSRSWMYFANWDPTRPEEP